MIAALIVHKKYNLDVFWTFFGRLLDVCRTSTKCCPQGKLLIEMQGKYGRFRHVSGTFQGVMEIDMYVQDIQNDVFQTFSKRIAQVLEILFLTRVPRPRKNVLGTF